MRHFTIENETSDIMIHGSAKEADAVPNTERFSNEAALAKLAANWPAARLVEIWNSIPGQTPVKKFKDRATADSRIWKAIQNLAEPAGIASDVSAPVAPQTPDVAPEEPPAKTRSKRTRKTPVAAIKTASGPREGSKVSQVIAMLKREGGTTLEEIMAAMDWQKHTTRALMSAGGALTKNHGLTVLSTKGKNGDRIYKIAK